MRALFERLPKPIRFHYLRKMIQVPFDEPPKNLEFKIAETREELEQAYQILHDTYVENKFQTPHPSGMRIIKYFALPTTTTLSAKWEGVVIGAPAVGLWSDVTTWENRFLKMYGDRAPNLNFHHYLTQEITGCLKFPERDYEKAMDPVMTPEILSYFFCEKSPVFDQLSPQDVLALHSCYPQKLYSLVLPKLTELNLRKTARYTVHALGETEIGSPMRLLDVSETGVRMQGPLPRRTKFKFVVNISPSQIARLSGIVQWIDPGTNSYGVEVLDHDDAWATYLKHLKGDFEIKKPKAS